MMHKTSHEELNMRLEAARQKVRVGDVYYHFKNPQQHYRVVALGFCEWDESVVVIYEQIGVEKPLTWVRRLEGEGGWLTPVTKEDGTSISRFIRVS